MSIDRYFKNDGYMHSEVCVEMLCCVSPVVGDRWGEGAKILGECKVKCTSGYKKEEWTRVVDAKRGRKGKCMEE